MIRTILRRAIRACLPTSYWTRVQSVRARNHQARWLESAGFLDLSRRFSAAHGLAVLHGPFAGMKYPPAALSSRYCVPMLLGCYERELHEIIQSALCGPYRTIIDVGSAEGYYAVGLAMKGHSPVAAFEANPSERNLCRDMAILNSVADRISIREWCSPAALQHLVAGERCFILSDCEGYEIELFDLPTVEALRLSDTLIEIHDDNYQPLLKRFSKTHRVHTIAASPRSVEDYPELAILGDQAERGLDEIRIPGQKWLFAEARSSLQAH